MGLAEKDSFIRQLKLQVIAQVGSKQLQVNDTHLLTRQKVWPAVCAKIYHVVSKINKFAIPPYKSQEPLSLWFFMNTFGKLPILFLLGKSLFRVTDSTLGSWLGDGTTCYT